MSRFVVDSPSYNFRPMEKQGGFDPRYLFYGGLDGVYFNAQDRGTIFSTSSLDTLSSVGGPVGGITDLSPNKHHHRQGTDSARPTFRRSESGIYSIQGDGDNDFLQNNTLNFNQPNTFILAFRINSSGQQTLLDSSNCANRNTFIINSDGTFRIYGGGGVLITTTETYSPDSGVLVISMIINGANSELYVNGELKASGNAGSESLAGLTLMTQCDAAANFSDAHLYSMVAVNGLISTSLRQRTESNLMNSAGESM